MRITTVLALVLALPAAYADQLECQGCVDTDDIRRQAVTTQKLAREAVTEGKLSLPVQKKLNGLVVTDGVGRKLPITINYVLADAAEGYLRTDEGDVVPLRIAPGPAGQPYQIFGENFTGYGSGRSILFTGSGCTGQAYVADYQNVGFLLPHGLITDPARPNRSRLIYRIGDELTGPMTRQSYLSDFVGCVDIDTGGLTDGTVLDNYLGWYPGRDDSVTQGPIVGPEVFYFAVSFAGNLRWVPPLTIQEATP